MMACMGTEQKTGSKETVVILTYCVRHDLGPSRVALIGLGTWRGFHGVCNLETNLGLIKLIWALLSRSARQFTERSAVAPLT